MLRAKCRRGFWRGRELNALSRRWSSLWLARPVCWMLASVPARFWVLWPFLRPLTASCGVLQPILRKAGRRGASRMRDNRQAVKRLNRFFCDGCAIISQPAFFACHWGAVCTAESLLSVASAELVRQEGGIVRMLRVAVKSFFDLFWTQVVGECAEWLCGCDDTAPVLQHNAANAAAESRRGGGR